MAVFNEACIQNYSIDSVINEFAREVSFSRSICEASIITEGSFAESVKAFIKKLIESIKTFAKKFKEKMEAFFDKIKDLIGKRSQKKTQADKNREMTDEERKTHDNMGGFEPSRIDISRFSEDKIIKAAVDSDIKVYDCSILDSKSINDVKSIDDCELTGKNREEFIEYLYHECNKGVAAPTELSQLYMKNMFGESLSNLERAANLGIGDDEEARERKAQAEANSNFLKIQAEVYAKNISAYTRICQIYNSMI